MKNIFKILTILLLLNSCKQVESFADCDNYLFQNPQPINDSELNNIPNKFHGTYLSSDSTYLKINDKYIFEERFSKFKIHKKALDSLKNEFEIIDGAYFEKITKEKYVPIIIGDSVEMSLKKIDTIFQFSPNQKAKRVNGQLIISEKDSVFWKMKSINLNKNALKIMQISSNEDLNRLDSLMKIKSKMIDSTTFIINPSRAEFVKLLNLNHFGYQQEFKKTTK